MTDTVNTTESTAPAVEAKETTPALHADVAKVDTSEKSWLSSLPEDIRGESSLTKFKDVGSLAKSYVHAEKELSSRIRIPSEEASAEARAEFYAKLTKVPDVVKLPSKDNIEEQNAFYNRLGRPETADKYDINLPVDLASNADAVNDLKSFTEIAHKNGLTKDQAKALVEFNLSKHAKLVGDRIKARDAAAETLKKAWGSEFDNRLQLAQTVINHLGGDDKASIEALVNSDAGNNPVLLKALAELGKVYMETGAVKGHAPTQFGLTPEEALSRIQELKGNKDSPYFNPRHPEHNKVRDRVEQLYKTAYPHDKQ